MQLMLLMQQHFAQLLHLSESNFNRQKDNIAICGVVVAIARCRWVATITEFKTRIKHLTLIERRLLHLTLEISSKLFSLSTS